MSLREAISPSPHSRAPLSQGEGGPSRSCTTLPHHVPWGVKDILCLSRSIDGEDKLILAYFPLKIKLWKMNLTKTRLRERSKKRERGGSMRDEESG